MRIASRFVLVSAAVAAVAATSVGSAAAVVSKSGSKSCSSTRVVSVKSYENQGTTYHTYAKTSQMFSHYFATQTDWVTVSSAHNSNWEATASIFMLLSPTNATCEL